MSYLKSKFSLCALDLLDPIDGIKFHDSLLAKKFVELTPSQELGHGWVAVDDMFKVDFTAEDIVAGVYKTIGYRYDQKTVPKSLIKKLYKERLKERKKMGEKLEEVDRNILKDECKAQLILQVLPNPKYCHCIFDLNQKVVFVDTKSAKVLDGFRMLLGETFSVKTNLKSFGLVENQLDKFLDWIWVDEKSRKSEGIAINKDIELDADKTKFNFTGPNLETYMKEINSFRDTKVIKKLGLFMSIGPEDYSVLLNNKNFLLTIETLSKIKHESVETAILDNASNLQSICDKVTSIVNKFLTK